jgi:DNA-binding transcriptional ArsR family regulator
LAASEATFGLLASPVRLHLVWLITHGPYDVCILAGIGITTASQHLGKLRLARVITARREGKRYLYAGPAGYYGYSVSSASRQRPRC